MMPMPGPYETAKPGQSELLSPARAFLQFFSPGGRRGRLSILIYHRVPAQVDPLFPEGGDVESFDQQMGLLKDCFRVIPLADAVRGLRSGGLPSRAACVTFDDGYADNAEIALPILKKHAIPATFFISSGVLDGGRMWNDTVIELVRRAPGDTLDLGTLNLGSFPVETLAQRRKAIDDLIGQLKHLPPESRQSRVEKMCSIIPVNPPDNLMMTSEQVRSLHGAGMEIGGHTVFHPILASTEKSAARAEIANGKEMLEGIIRAPVRFFAYPNGKPERDYLPEHVAMVRESGFEAAVSTAYGAARPGDDLYQLPRFTPWDRGGSARFVFRMVQNMFRNTEKVLH
jgi:peptidoglycan/xylan/chitin deacetylase (PgdA/CDA1 family)